MAITACLTAAACSAGDSRPAIPTAVPLLTVTATPQMTASPQTPPTPSATAPAMYLPPNFDGTRPAWQDIQAALNKAAIDGKPVLIDFSSSWCPACQELQHALQTSRAQAMERSLHLVRVDTGPRTAGANLDIAMAYGVDLEKTGIPGLVLLSPHGEVEETTANGLFDNDQPITSSEVIGFVKPHL